MMKKLLILLIFSLFLVGCGPAKLRKHEANVEFRVVKVPMVVENDTIIINELRFYEIANALQTMQLTYDNHGKWNSTMDGRYQSNLPQLIWTNVKLLDQNEPFTVSACGTETIAEYFSSVIILDKDNKDSLSENHPRRDELIAYFATGMKNLIRKSDFYAEYRSR